VKSRVKKDKRGSWSTFGKKATGIIESSFLNLLRLKRKTTAKKKDDSPKDDSEKARKQNNRP